LAEGLSDDGLAFVIAHEMAHHDLEHFGPTMVAAGWLGHAPRLEYQADKRGLDLLLRSGFSGQGALEALDPGFWSGDSPPDEPTEPSELRQMWAQWRRRHPPLQDRLRAIRHSLQTG
jgi:Zn-dependent protease with chaperone function